MTYTGEAPLLNLLRDPRVRLAGRALFAGVAVAVAQIQGSGDFSSSAIKAAAVAGALAAFEILTPINALVGLGKQDVHEDA